MALIDGKAVASKILERLKLEVSEMGKKPGLAIILVGDNPASQVYVNIKEKRCNEIGIECNKIILEKETSEEEVLAKIDELNRKDDVDGIIVQLPLPGYIDKRRVLNAIEPKKDVDGLHPLNLGSLVIGDNKLLPATASGVMKLLDSLEIGLSGKHACVIGRSELVGKPVSLLLQQRNCTVTMCHSRTERLEDITRFSDILVVAAGRPGMIKKEMVKPGCIVIDVGISKLDGKIVGDVDPDVEEVAGYLSPVPGGVGPMTVACLLENVVNSCKEDVSQKASGE